MKKRRIFLIVTIVLITILLAASPAMATATRTEWTEQNNYCDVSCTDENGCVGFIADGKILQVRGEVQYIRVLRFDPVTLEEFPEWNGWTTSINNYDLNLVTGIGNSWGKFTREYDGVNGTFEGIWSGQIRDFHFTGKISGQGTGDLEGQIVKGWLNDVPIEDLPLKSPCEPASIWGEVNHGYILNPQGQ
jgi:hypothetical protein